MSECETGGKIVELPVLFVDKMKSLLGEDYTNYINCYEKPRFYGLRVNTAKITVEDFLKIAPWKLDPIPWIDNGFYYDGEQVQPAKHPYYFAGLYYLQEPSAMTPANRLPVEPGDRVLDVCAAPGGKATELGAKLQGEGVLIANDISSSRAKGLLKNLELFGVGNFLVLSEEPGKLMNYFPEYFDKILIDAPCSGEGMFRKDKKMVKAWEEHGPEFFSKLQRGIITQAAQMLKPGGMLLYSTCTFDPLENEHTIAYLLEEYPQFQIIEMKGYEGFAEGMAKVLEKNSHESQEALAEDIKRTVRIFPHQMNGEGHYLALLKKGNSHIEDTDGTLLKGKKQLAGKGKELPEDLRHFFEQVSWTPDANRLEIHGERVYYMPEGLPKMNGIRFLRTGLLMGELKKKRFEPSQALAMHLQAKDYAHTLQFPVEDERVVRYLKGETLQVEDLVDRKDKGWYLVCIDKYPLGWGKLANGMLKNKYLPGWRWQSA